MWHCLLGDNGLIPGPAQGVKASGTAAAAAGIHSLAGMHWVQPKKINKNKRRELNHNTYRMPRRPQQSSQESRVLMSCLEDLGKTWNTSFFLLVTTHCSSSKFLITGPACLSSLISHHKLLCSLCSPLIKLLSDPQHALSSLCLCPGCSLCL